jgi:PGF-pre-PGF domain-containing protein
MMKNIILFITVATIMSIGMISVSGAPPFDIKAPQDIVQEATGVMTYIPDLGMPYVFPPSAKYTRDPPGNNFPLGRTDITWSVDNGAVFDVQTVTVEDTKAPIITIVGQSVVTIAVGDNYTDEGATATDIVDGDVTAKIQNVSNVDTNVAGTYSVIYDVSDSSGNKAEQKIRTVIVNALPTDTVPPTIVPPSNVTIEATGILTHVTLVPPAVTDNVDTSPTVTNDAPAESNFSLGNTTVIWKACDHATPTPNCNIASQLVTIIDTTAPSIISPQDINIRSDGGTTNINLGNVTVNDLVDSNPIVTNDAPAGDNFTVGDTVVTWKACDHSGNCNTATQLVTVSSQGVGAIILDHNPPSWSINITDPSTIEFNITTDQKVNVTWSIDGIHAISNDSYSVVYASYVGAINTIGNHAVTVYIENENGSYNRSWNLTVIGELKISANPSSVIVGQPTNVTFNITRKCGIENGDNQTYCVAQPYIPFSGINVHVAEVTGNYTGSGITDANGQTVILVNASNVGTVLATASNPGYSDGSTNIMADVAPAPSSGDNGGNGGSNGGGGGDSSSGGGGGGGGGGAGTAEPYDNVLKYEVQERSVFTIPVSFQYLTSELAIYDVLVTSTQTSIAALRIEVLKNTSKLVDKPMSGIVYKNINAWMDYKRIKNATIRYKVENSWISSNGLLNSDIKMSKWDNSSKVWTELPTAVANKDEIFTYFESQVDNLSGSFAISGEKDSIARDSTDNQYIDTNVTPGETGTDPTAPDPTGAEPDNQTKSIGNKFPKTETVLSLIVVGSVIYLYRTKRKK